MGVKTGKRNVKSNRHAVTTDYTEVTFFTNHENLVGIYVPSDGAFLSVGHAVPDDATSIDLPAGASWEVPYGIVGKIFIKSKVAAFSASLYGA